MKHRMLSALLALVLVLGVAPGALAAPPAEEEAAQVLAALDIMVGDEKGDLALDRTITRAEFTKMTVAASTSRDTVGDTVSVKPYPDVPQTHWAAPYVKAAVDLGLVQGDLYGNFNPDRKITLAEGVTMVLRLLGYADSDFTGLWPAGQMAQYRALDLDEGVNCAQSENMTRRDALYLFYNLMITKNKSGMYHLNVLEPTLNLVNAAGELDRVGLINSAMEGPVVASANWQDALPFHAATATVYRNGKASAVSSIQTQDVLYWSKSMRTIWAYSDKATGTLEAVSPSASAPTSVTVAGKIYAIETTSAAYELSDLGSYTVGDQVTLLLGRNGGVAALGQDPGEGALIYGVITKVENLPYDDGNNGTYTARTVTVAATDGSSYRYQCSEKSLEEGDLVQVVVGDGDVRLKRLSKAALAGKVSSDGRKLGRYTLADDVQIIDTYESRTPIRVYPSRLAGMELTDSMVLYYALNSDGEISRLILNDATGDLHQYGIITDVNEVNVTLPTGGFQIASSYTYVVGGQELVFGSNSKIFNLKTGPCQVKMDSDATIERLYNLTERKLDSVSASGNFAVGADGRQYALSERVTVYVYDKGEYLLSSLSKVTEGDYTLTGWYDKSESAGGRIRVVVAR